MADNVNLTPGSMAAAGGPLTDRGEVMGPPGTVPGTDPAAADATDARQLVHGAPGGTAAGTWDDVSGQRPTWR